MSLSEQERDTLVQLQLEKAYSIFGQIWRLKEFGYWDTLANRLYYSAFHAAIALIINDGYPLSFPSRKIISPPGLTVREIWRNFTAQIVIQRRIDYGKRREESDQEEEKGGHLC